MQERLYDRKAKARSYQPGDWVLLLIFYYSITPGLDKPNSSAAAAVFYIGLWEFTRQYLVAKQFLPDDLMKKI